MLETNQTQFGGNTGVHTLQDVGSHGLEILVVKRRIADLNTSTGSNRLGADHPLLVTIPGNGLQPTLLKPDYQVRGLGRHMDENMDVPALRLTSFMDPNPSRFASEARDRFGQEVHEVSCRSNHSRKRNPSRLPVDVDHAVEWQADLAGKTGRGKKVLYLIAFERVAFAA